MVETDKPPAIGADVNAMRRRRPARFFAAGGSPLALATDVLKLA